MDHIRTIRVTGTGSLKVRPDMTRITMTLQGLDKDYAQVLKRSSEETNTLAEVLAGFGFAREDLKTLNFNVDTEYESYQEEGAWKQRFLGYRFHHMLKVEFGLDDERLGRILYALANCPVDPELRISYTVRDPEASRNALIAAAVADAKAKASVLSDAAGVALGGILLIDYSRGEVMIEAAPMNRMLMAKGAAAEDASYAMDIRPDDIEVNDTVTVVWAIA